MAEIKTVLTALLIASLALNICMLAFAFSRKDKRRALYLSLLAMAILFYTLGYLLELHATTPGEAMIALRVENIGIPLITPFFLLTALGFYQPRLLRPWMTAACAVYGSIMFLLIFFNDKHLLYYLSIDMQYNGSFYAVHLGRGPLYFFQQFTSTSGMVFVYALAGRPIYTRFVKAAPSNELFYCRLFVRICRKYSIFFNVIPIRIDPVPFSLNVGLVFFSIILYKYKLMDIVPAAFEMAVENMDDAIIVMDSEWGFIYCNRQAKSLFPALNGFSGSEEIMRAAGWPPEISPRSDKEITFDVLNPVTAKVTLQQASVNDIFDNFGKMIGVSVIIRDITETTNMFRQIEALAITDHLTGVYNRRHFMTLIEREMGIAQRHSLPVSILMLDIDHFKNINDTYSHLAGDYILRKVAQTIANQMRAHDVIARYGGEEFVILSAEKNELGLLHFAERLRKVIEDGVFTFEGNTIPITASFGAVMIMPGQSFESAMAAVDKALYNAKNSGRNNVILGMVLEENDSGVLN